MRKQRRMILWFLVLTYFGIFTSSVSLYAWPVTPYRELRYEYVNGQNTTGSCGPASLATLFTSFYGKEISEEEIIAIMKPFFEEELAAQEEEREIPEGGVSMLDLKMTSLGLGVPARGYEIPREKLGEVIEVLSSPVLLHLDNPDEHFVLAVGDIASKVLLADPTWGLYLIGLERLYERWDGLILAFAPGKAFVGNAGRVTDEITLLAAERIASQRLSMEFLW